jgi:hypothetical protein
VLSYFAGKNRRTSTKEESLSKAKEIAEDWYLQLRGKLRAGEIKSEKTFREVSDQYLREYDIITLGQRNNEYVDGQHWRSRVHLVPFFGNLGISEITAGKIQEYRIHRHQEAIANRGKPPGHSTIHHEIVTLRQTLKSVIVRCAIAHPGAPVGRSGIPRPMPPTHAGRVQENWARSEQTVFSHAPGSAQLTA